MSNPSTFLREKQEDGGTREEQEKKKTCMRRAMLSMQQHPLTWVWDGLFHWGAHYCSKEKQITGEIKETERYKTRENGPVERSFLVIFHALLGRHSMYLSVSFNSPVICFGVFAAVVCPSMKQSIPHSSQGVLLHGKHCPSHTCFLLLLFLSCSSIFLLLSEKSAWVAHKPWILSCVCLLITVHLTLVVPTL